MRCTGDGAREQTSAADPASGISQRQRPRSPRWPEQQLDTSDSLTLPLPQRIRSVHHRSGALDGVALSSRRLAGFKSLLRDGTSTMMFGTLIAGLATYAWQAGGTRTLGKTAFAPVANTWTVYFLIVTILLVPIEQFATRTVAAGRNGDVRLARALRVLGLVLVTASLAVGLACYLLRASLFDGSGEYALVACAIVLSLGQLAICRGILVGKRKFAAYGWVTGLDSTIRLAIGLPVVLLSSSPLAFVWTIPLSSLVALGWLREWPRIGKARAAGDIDALHEIEGGAPVGRFLATTVGGTSAAQLLLAGGPLLLALLGASESAVTVLFVTQTACRAAFLMATPAAARSLPPLTRLAVRSDYRRLGNIALGLLASAIVLAVVVGAASTIVTPPLIAALFGSGVRPDKLVAATMAAGTILAISNMGLNQILVAVARTHRITIAWWVAVAAAMCWVLLGPGDPLQTVSVGFVIGELVALVALALASNIGLRSQSSEGLPSTSTPRARLRRRTLTTEVGRRARPPLAGHGSTSSSPTPPPRQ
jgi:O-antigen/teichoic acid export membrane protein